MNRTSRIKSATAHQRNTSGRWGTGSSERYVLFALGWYYPEIHRGVVRFARDHQWHVTADFDDLVPRHWRGDGVITLLGARQNLWKSLRKLDVPIVDLAESRPNIRLPRVTMDNAAIGRMAARYFLDRGYRNFAFFHRWGWVRVIGDVIPLRPNSPGMVIIVKYSHGGRDGERRPTHATSAISG